MSEKPKAYKTAGAFRTALEARLQNRARAEGTDLQRLRRQVAFDRLLARLFSKGPKAEYPWVLKGGYAMELRTHTARTTKDIDLTLLSDGTPLAKDPKEQREQVRACCRKPRPFFLTISLNFSSVKQERTWTVLRKAGAVTPSRHAWMDAILRDFTSTSGSGTKCWILSRS
jgi:hypothetical protein